ncbi:hypothetical protein PSEUBRA_001174 [Kalmanozyma brasiliensis GHG001]|uniref:uncharacterized protein n=1 Tax=Kalmanozyma brasiliensis (strain GHG001) TaxID=1365824 RepID=UPI0028680270|nr:uncharacterized protein PSEUBRA_001174 [Kalmanozyma brasiliensis GHG001]EST09221.2 hypothetical protein PSEUBRA_001174 [Kalmanozyma brasiliensis GHG001]
MDVPTSLPDALPDIAQVLRKLSPDAPGFPLAANASAREMLTFVDALALKIYPKGYWQLTWTLNAINLFCFFSVTLALRTYRSHKSPTPFWLFKLEHRPYRVKRTLSSKKPAEAQKRGEQAIRLGSTTTSPGKLQTSDHMRMGRFITASCVNCHLLFTSAYVILLCLQVIESYLARGAFAAPPLLEPALLDTFMLFAIYSTAYFAAIGYIALLLPNVPPWMWNSTVVLYYVGAVVIGLTCKFSIASSLSRINAFRVGVHEGFALLPGFDELLNYGIPRVDETARILLLNIVKEAYKESLCCKKWQQCIHVLVVLNGYTLALGYLVILVLLSRRVAKELAQLRKSPSSHYVDKDAAPMDFPTVAALPSVAARFTMPLGAPQTPTPTSPWSITHHHRFSLPPYGMIRTPPPTPAPTGPLPSPPADDSQPASRSSTPESLAYEVGDTHGRSHSVFHARPASFPTRSVQVGNLLTEKPTQGLSSRDRKGSKQESYGVFPVHQDVRAASLGDIDATRLRLGPRTRRDSCPAPWDLDTLHGDLASNEGYAAVCRFLFNCIIDHVMIMLQCFVFGTHSVYLLCVFTRDYPNDPQVASSKQGVATMVSAVSFTVLYYINCLNLFAPFLLFPASQVKLATMLASLTLPEHRPEVDVECHAGVSHSQLQGAGRETSRRDSVQSHRVASGRTKVVPELKHQNSSRALINSASKETSETYTSGLLSKHASERQSNTSHQSSAGSARNSIIGDDQESVWNNARSAYVCVPAFSSPRQHARSKANLHKDQHPNECATADKIAAHVAAAVRLFRSSSSTNVSGQGRKACAVPDGSKPDISHASDTVTSPASTFRPASLSEEEPKAGTKSLGWAFSPFSRDRVGDTKPSSLSAWRFPKSRDEAAARKRRPGFETDLTLDTISDSNQAPRTSPSAQLVLDSLISSHALPIRGFYCHMNAADESASQRHYDVHSSIESGFWTYEGPILAEKRQSCINQAHTYQYARECEAREELTKLQGESDAEDFGTVGEASMPRRQRLRQQFYSQVDQRRRSSSPAPQAGQVRLSSSNRLAPGTQECGNVRSIRTVKLFGTELRSDSHTTVPTIVAQPPTPEPSATPSFRPSQEYGQETTISLPLTVSPLSASIYLADEDDERDFRTQDAEQSDDDDDASIASSTFGGA